MSTRSQMEDHHAEVANELAESVSKSMNELHEKVATEGHAAAMSALERLELDTSLGFFPALLLLIASGIGVGLAIYFFLMLSDLTDDLINPYSLVERINSKLKIELAAHAIAVFSVMVAMHPWLTLLTLPALALRALWHTQKKLVVDATTCYNSKVQSQLRTRWGLMCGWHVVGTLFGFIQVLLHGIMALHRAAPHAMGDMHELHAKANGIHGIGHAHMLAGLNHF